MASVILSLLFFFISSTVSAQQNYSNVTLGSSLSPKTSLSSWVSSSGEFAFGFYPQGEGHFIVAIWFARIPEKTVIWVYNQERPHVPSNTTVQMTMDGKLILQPAQGKGESISAAKEPASSASMLNSGNFVLYNSSSDIIWQSFSVPTDSILQGQKLLTGSVLYSSVSRTDSTKGRFQLNMQSDGYLVQYPIENPVTVNYAYWVSSTQSLGDNVILNLDKNGHLYLLNNTGFTVQNISDAVDDSDDTIFYRMTVDWDGILRLYSLRRDGNWSIMWSSFDNKCTPRGLCGLNGYCTIMDEDAKCICLPGFNFLDSSQPMLGCGINTSVDGCGKAEMHRQENTEWENDPYSILSSTNVEDCTEMCLTDCNCEAAIFSELKCKKQRLPMRFGKRGSSNAPTVLIKVGTSRLTVPNEPKENKPGKKKNRFEILIISVAVAAVGFVILIISGILIYRHRVWVYNKISDDTRGLGISDEISLRSYTYSELENATNGFREELGRGSFGIVFKGLVSNGKTIIAVKRLERVVDEGEREFQTEMRVIGRTYHKNLVRLLGYCHEGPNRLLVYEYMRNGSLENFLFKPEKTPCWNDRVRIALNIARGIVYLHEECETQIIHCDIKPQNILIDEFFCAKIADFGLAKLLKPDQTRSFTGVRGTRGYVAPEWHKNLPVTVKVDVYSYGIMLMEIICCRKSLNMTLPEDEIVLSDWVYQCFQEGELGKLIHDEDIGMRKLEKMVTLAIWCIQDDPALRPCMKEVVLMLEETIEIPVLTGPTSFLSSI